MEFSLYLTQKSKRELFVSLFIVFTAELIIFNPNIDLRGLDFSVTKTEF